MVLVLASGCNGEDERWECWEKGEQGEHEGEWKNWKEDREEWKTLKECEKDDGGQLHPKPKPTPVL
jgi:hypothetical protein